MTILRARVVWTRPRPQNETRRASDLTPEEQANVKRALHVLRRRLGTYKALGAALRVNPHSLVGYGKRRGRPTAGIAVRAARLARVAVEDVLTGKWPRDGSCPHCGRT